MKLYTRYISYFLLSAILSGVLYRVHGVFDIGNMICWILTVLFIYKTDRNIFFRFFCIFSTALAVAHTAIDTVFYHSKLSSSSFYLYYDIPNYVLWVVIFSRMIDNAIWLQNEKLSSRILVLSTISLLIGLSILCIIELFVAGGGGDGTLRTLIFVPLLYLLMRYYGQKEKSR